MQEREGNPAPLREAKRGGCRVKRIGERQEEHGVRRRGHWPGKAGPTKEGRESRGSEKAPVGSSSSTEGPQTWKRKGQSGSGSQSGVWSPGKAKGCPCCSAG